MGDPGERCFYGGGGRGGGLRAVLGYGGMKLRHNQLGSKHDGYRDEQEQKNETRGHQRLCRER